MKVIIFADKFGEMRKKIDEKSIEFEVVEKDASGRPVEIRKSEHNEVIVPIKYKYKDIETFTQFLLPESVFLKNWKKAIYKKILLRIFNDIEIEENHERLKKQFKLDKNTDMSKHLHNVIQQTKIDHLNKKFKKEDIK